jgi:predicted transcriptional regulator
MAELTQTEKEVVKAMEELGATKESGIRSADEITRKANRPKGLVTNVLSSLVIKKVAKRVAKEKSAGYYVTKA